MTSTAEHTVVAAEVQLAGRQVAGRALDLDLVAPLARQGHTGFRADDLYFGPRLTQAVERVQGLDLLVQRPDGDRGTLAFEWPIVRRIRSLSDRAARDGGGGLAPAPSGLTEVRRKLALESRPPDRLSRRALRCGRLVAPTAVVVIPIAGVEGREHEYGDDHKREDRPRNRQTHPGGRVEPKPARADQDDLHSGTHRDRAHEHGHDEHHDTERGVSGHPASHLTG